MVTRFTAKPSSMFGVPTLATGFNNVSIPTNLSIPPVGIEDVDTSLFKLFNDVLKLAVKTKEGIKSVPVIFASGEKWAMLKRGRALRDKAGSLILPLITLGRTNIQQNPSDDQAGRGINQQTGELVIKRRLADDDRNYQNIINKTLMTNQENVAVDPDDLTLSNQITTERLQGDTYNDSAVISGGLLAGNNRNNVWEFITIPSPQFFTAIYDVTIWTSYTSQMNEILEGLISSFLPQGNAWRLETEKGYWFIATVDGNLYSPENNFDDMSGTERIIKYKFTVKVPGYILASRVPGANVPLRRTISNPDISFNLTTVDDMCSGGGIDDPFLGSDDPTLPLDVVASKRNDQRYDGKTRLYPNVGSLSPQDPALTKLYRGMPVAKYKRVTGIDRYGKPVNKFVRIKKINPYTGEMIFACLDIDGRSAGTVVVGESFFVIDQEGNLVVDSSGNAVVFSV